MPVTTQVRGCSAAGPPPPGPASQPTGGPRGGRRLRLLARKLELTDDQVETLRSRLTEHRAQGREIVRDVLDDEQKQRFDRHQERRRRHHRRFRHHGAGTS